MKSTVVLLTAAVVAGCASSGSTGSTDRMPENGTPLIVQPGAPGQAGRTFSTDELSRVEGVSHTDADVAFMRGMIPHHQQALEMTALVRQHASTNAVRQMALRMEISQRDEIALMETWLQERGESTTMPGMGGMNGMHMMPGMLTPEQMNALRNARGTEFDRLFLEGMIQHHQGAIDMVATLFNTSGAAQESTVFKFAEDVDADQQMEIERMEGILATIR